MMKRCILFIGLYFMIASMFGQASPDEKKREQLHYILRYGWIEGGSASLISFDTIIGTDTLDFIKMHARSVGITDRLYKVSDIYESYVDPVSGLPIKAIRDIHEGGYDDYNEVIFNNDSNYVLSQKSGKVVVPLNTFDILSSVYHLRELIKEIGLEYDKVIRIETYFGDDLFPLILRYKGTEKVETELGEISCHKFAPVTEVGRVFKTEDDMTMWFSEDDNFIPVRVQLELFIGSLKCDLISYSGLPFKLAVN